MVRKKELNFFSISELGRLLQLLRTSEFKIRVELRSNLFIGITQTVKNIIRGINI